MKPTLTPHDYSRSSNASERPRQRQFARLLFVLVSIGLVALAVSGELIIRYREQHRSRPPDFLPTIYYPHTRIRTGLVPNADYFGWVKINSLGFRGEPVAPQKPPGTLRIVCFGGSTTFDVANLAEVDSWPQVMRQQLALRFPQLQIEVLNLGVPGATSLDSLIDFQIRGLSLQPDIIVMYQGHNDFRYTIDPPKIPVVREKLHPNEQQPRSGLVRWLQSNSLLYGKTAHRVSAMTATIATALGLRPLRAVTEDERMARIERGIGEFRSNARSLVAIAESNGIEVVLPSVIFPMPAMPTTTQTCNVCSEMTTGRGYRGVSAETIVSGYSAYREIVRDLAATHKTVMYVETAGWVPHEDVYYADPVHFSRPGSLIMGRKMAEALTPLLNRMLEKD